MNTETSSLLSMMMTHEESHELLNKVKEIYGEECNNWEDDETFLFACGERESVFERYHEGTLVELETLEKQQEENEKLKEEMKKLKEERDKYFKYLKDKDLECENLREHA